MRTLITILALSLTASAGVPFHFSLTSWGPTPTITSIHCATTSTSTSAHTHTKKHGASTTEKLVASTAAHIFNPIATGPSEHGPLPFGLVGWRGSIKEGGENITLTGLSHHDIISQLANLQPHWMLNGSTTTASANEAADENGLEKRGRVKYLCGNGYPIGTYDYAVRDGNAIASTMGNGQCGVAPRACGRFACYKGTGVAMCNDDPNNWVWLPCSDLATNVRFIISSCGTGGVGAKEVEGQSFYENPTYNVLVKGGYNC